MREEGQMIFWWVVFGVLVGVIAALLLTAGDGPGRSYRPMGRADTGTYVICAVLGILGAFLGGFTLRLFTREIPPTFISSTVGAVVILGVFRLLLGARR
jgi:uncharacterized membrane protein YeaQ/YmgE (transglycosylase-associated protein family)